MAGGYYSPLCSGCKVTLCLCLNTMFSRETLPSKTKQLYGFLLLGAIIWLSLQLTLAGEATQDNNLASLRRNIERRHTTVATVLETLKRASEVSELQKEFSNLTQLCSNRYTETCNALPTSVKSCTNFTSWGGKEKCLNLSSSTTTQSQSACSMIDLFCRGCLDEAFNNADINYEPYKKHAMLAVHNANLLIELLHKQPLEVDHYPMPLNEFGDGTLAASSCNDGHNFFGEGNIVFSTRTRISILSNDIVLAIGMCLGNGSQLDPHSCFYTSRDVKNRGPNTTHLLYYYAPNYELNHSRTEVEWFTLPRSRFNQLLLSNLSMNDQMEYSIFLPRPPSGPASLEMDTVRIGYDKELWSQPYFDCLLGHRWMITYSAPVLRYFNGRLKYLGMTGVDIDLSNIPINQCSLTEETGTGFEHLFRDTHLCEPVSTWCRTDSKIRLFRIGSYNCHCRKGFYKHNASSTEQYFRGSAVELLDDTSLVPAGIRLNKALWAEFLSNRTNSVLAGLRARYACLPCPRGCEMCLTGREVCLYEEKEAILYPLITLNIIVLLLSFVLLVFIVHHRMKKVVKSASWPFLVIIIVGAQIADASLLLLGFTTNTRANCLAFTWLNMTAFSVTYGAIFVKTWRLWKIFQPAMMRRGAKKTHLTNRDLAIRLAFIIAGFAVLLLLYTLSENHEPVTRKTASGQKYKFCAESAVKYVLHGGKCR